MNRTRSVLVALLAGLGGACHCASAPSAPPALPAGLDGDPSTYFALDTTTAEFDGELHDAPAGARLLGRLGSSKGERAIVFTPPGGKELTLAPAGWNLPPAGAFRAPDDALVCWNALTGEVPAGWAMPHPSGGLPVLCRRIHAGVAGEVITVAGELAPTWLADVEVADGVWHVRYLRDPGGWFFQGGGPVTAFERTFDGKTLGAAQDAPAELTLSPE